MGFTLILTNNYFNISIVMITEFRNTLPLYRFDCTLIIFMLFYFSTL